jgi:ABC-type transport system involved in multi-copper enzyme maturation permease subunit
MPIYDQTFRRYTGPRNLRALWWPVTWFTFRPILKRKLVWILLVGFVLYLGAISLGFFASAKMGEFIYERQSREAARAIRREGIRMFGSDISLGTILYSVMQPLKMLLWLLVLVAGSGCISSDRRHNALPLYFSRPLKPWQYTFGKILGVAIMPLAAMLITQWVAGLQYIAWYYPFSALFTEIPTFLSAGVYAIILCGFIATVMASVSSMARSSRVAGVGFLVFFVLLENIVPLLAKTAGNTDLLALSPLHATDVIGRTLLAPDLHEISSSVETGKLSIQLAVIAVAAYSALFLYALRRNLRVVEVVK